MSGEHRTGTPVRQLIAQLEEERARNAERGNLFPINGHSVFPDDIDLTLTREGNRA
jgi:hypothetical protein